MNTRQTFLSAVIVLLVGSSAWACGGSCYRTPVYPIQIRIQAARHFVEQSRVQRAKPGLPNAVNTRTNRQLSVPPATSSSFAVPESVPQPAVTPDPVKVEAPVEVPVPAAVPAPVVPKQRPTVLPSAAIKPVVPATEVPVSNQVENKKAKTLADLDTQTLLKLAGLE